MAAAAAAPGTSATDHPLLAAARTGDPKAIAASLAASTRSSSDVASALDARTRRRGYTALHVAASRGHAAAVAALVSAGADVNARTLKQGRIPALVLAAKQGHADVIRVLLALAPPTSPPRSAASAADGAGDDGAAGGPSAHVDTVADRADTPDTTQPSVDLNARSSWYNKRTKLVVPACGHTALNLAAVKGRAQVVALLAEAGADPNVCDHAGDTPLFNALKCRVIDVARALLPCTAAEREARLHTFEKPPSAAHMEPALGEFAVGRREGGAGADADAGGGGGSDDSDGNMSSAGTSNGGASMPALLRRVHSDGNVASTTSGPHRGARLPVITVDPFSLNGGFRDRGIVRRAWNQSAWEVALSELSTDLSIEVATRCLNTRRRVMRSVFGKKRRVVYSGLDVLVASGAIGRLVERFHETSEEAYATLLTHCAVSRVLDALWALRARRVFVQRLGFDLAVMLAATTAATLQDLTASPAGGGGGAAEVVATGDSDAGGAEAPLMTASELGRFVKAGSEVLLTVLVAARWCVGTLARWRLARAERQRRDRELAAHKAKGAKAVPAAGTEGPSSGKEGKPAAKREHSDTDADAARVWPVPHLELAPYPQGYVYVEHVLFALTLLMATLRLVARPALLTPAPGSVATVCVALGDDSTIAAASMAPQATSWLPAVQCLAAALLAEWDEALIAAATLLSWALLGRHLLLSPQMGPLLAALEAMLKKVSVVMTLFLGLGLPFAVVFFMIDAFSDVLSLSGSVTATLEGQLTGGALMSAADACAAGTFACVVHFLFLGLGPLMLLNTVVALFAGEYDAVMSHAEARHNAHVASFVLCTALEDPSIMAAARAGCGAPAEGDAQLGAGDSLAASKAGGGTAAQAARGLLSHCEGRANSQFFGPSTSTQVLGTDLKVTDTGDGGAAGSGVDAVAVQSAVAQAVSAAMSAAASASATTAEVARLREAVEAQARAIDALLAAHNGKEPAAVA